MKIIHTIEEMQKLAFHLKQEGKSIGYVATMGFLHEGHQQLMQNARKDNDVLVLSIFVNPLQFGPNEDFDRYPRDEEHDRKIAENELVDFLFFPTVDDMYPEELAIQMKVKDRANVLCGKSREGHFDGVVTVLLKLFHIILPDRVYFGLKDAQQVAVVDALIKNFNFPIELIPIPTVREENGLAKSSRNVYLNEEEKNEAKYIYQALNHGRDLVLNGESSPEKIVSEVIRFINEKTRGKIDYVELLAYPELQPVHEINQRVILASAVYFEKARLIDNLIFESNGELTYRH